MVGYPFIAYIYNQFSEIIFAIQNENARSEEWLKNISLQEQTLHTILIISGLKKKQFSTKEIHSLNFFSFVGFREKGEGEGRGQREKGRGRGRERKRHQFVVLLIHSFIDSCVCPHLGSNMQLWCIEMML